MKLSHGLVLVAAGLSSATLLTATGCSSSSSGGSGGGSSGGASDQCGVTGGLPASQCSPPPSPPTGASATTNTKSHNYAIHKLYLGDTDRSGQPSADAWKSFGYNLDGKVTTSASTDVCTLVAGSTKATQNDGTGGLDNSFGENIIPFITQLSPTASQTLNTDLQGGSFTVMTYVTGFDDSAGNKTNATGLKGVLLAGGKYNEDGGAPTWDLTTDWPVLPDPGLINGCTPYSAGGGGCPQGTDPVANAKIQFNSAFQINGTFVNGTAAPLTLSLSIGGQSLSLNIASAVITFQPSAPGSVQGGIIAGVLSTADLINGLKNVAGNISSSLCSGSAFNSLALQIQQTSDIMLASDGKTVSNGPGSTCNAISIGLGFDATEIGPPKTIAPATAPTPSKCDGG